MKNLKVKSGNLVKTSIVNDDYLQFLESKKKSIVESGFDIDEKDLNAKKAILI